MLITGAILTPSHIITKDGKPTQIYLWISQIIHGKRAITVDTAMRLARYFGTSAAVWLRMQVRYDLEVAEEEIGGRIAQEVVRLNQPIAHQ